MSTNNNITVYTCNNPYNAEFNYMIDVDSILIENKINQGWWFDLHIRIVDSISETERIIHVGMNRSSKFKLIKLNTGLIEEPIQKSDFDEKLDIVETLNPKIFYCNTVTPEDIILDKDDIIIALTSIIYVSNNKLNNNSSRSNVSPQDRYNQTLLNMKTIRKRIPQAKICLLEKSIYMPENEVTELSKYCDYMIRYIDNEECNYYAHEQTFNKGLGEMFVLTHFGNLIKDKSFKLFCKMCGRYRMTPSFNIKTHLISVPVFRYMYGDGRLGIIVFSNFYSIPRKFFNLYLEHTKVWLDKKQDKNIEHILTMFVESLPDLTLVSRVNIQGVGALGDGKSRIL